MALTATANQEVIEHVITGLNIPDCIRLKQSLNRPNLFYAVREKGTKVIEDLAEFIRSKHADSSGIVYCHSRKDCERVAEALRDKYGLSARHYHAGVSLETKHQTHHAWQSGMIKIIVSTASPRSLSRYRVRNARLIVIVRRLRSAWVSTRRTSDL